MNASGSPVVEIMRQASLAAWKTWRQHLENGTAGTPAGLAAFAAQRLAGSVWLGEARDRASVARDTAGGAA